MIWFDTGVASLVAFSGLSTREEPTLPTSLSTGMPWRRTVASCLRKVYPDVMDRATAARKAGPMPASPAFQAALGQAVKARRQELGFTQEQLDLRTDLHARWISNVENGKRNPSYASLRRLAAGLELTASELIARAEVLE